MSYRISTVAEVTGIPRNTLLAWERRYRLVLPTRHDNGYRSYSDRDVAVIFRLKNALAAGLRISEAVELLRRETQGVPPRGDEAPVRDFARLRTDLLSALWDYRRGDAESLLQKVARIPWPAQNRDVYLPVCRELGSRFQSGKITLAQERYATAILRAHLAALLVSSGAESGTAQSAITTTFPGDPSELVALALALQLGALGYRISYLGPSVSVADLAGFVARHQPALACVTSSSPPSEEAFDSYMKGLSPLTGTHFYLGDSLPSGDEAPGVTRIEEWARFSPPAPASIQGECP